MSCVNLKSRASVRLLFPFLGDLKRMHRTNEEAYMSTESRSRRAMASVDWTAATSRAEDKDSSLRRVLDDKGMYV